MNLPAPVAAALGDEEVAARVELKGEDALFVTRTRTLVYHGEGLLSDESAEEFPHDAERVEVNAGRRKAKLRLDYGLDGEREFAVPASSLEEALHPVLAGVLNAAGVTDAGETVTRTYRFSELTLVVTSHRVVKHVGAAVWDDEYEEIRYEDVTDLAVEEGTVASQLVMDAAGRSQRIKVPNDLVRDVHERVEEALLAYHDVATYDRFAELMADDDEPTPEPAADPAAATFESDLDPIDLTSLDEDEEDPTVPGTAADPAVAGSTADGSTAGGRADADPAGTDQVATDSPAADSADAGSTDTTPPTANGSATDPAEPAAGTAGTAVPGAGDGGAPAGGDAASGTGGAAAATADSGADEAAGDAAGDAVGAGREPGAGDDGFAEFETAVAEPADVREELQALRRTVERQRDLLARQAELVEEIAAELDDEG